MTKEFFSFLKQYGIVGLAIAVIIGGKLNEFIGSIVNDLIMPIILTIPLKAAGVDEIAKLQVGGIFYGKVIGAGINFIIVALVIFLFAKKVLKEESVTKK